jgi:protein involved in ribonucleotide reduction
LIVYFSNVSNFTHRFVEKLEVPASRIPIKAEEAGTFTISEPATLILPTYGANGRDFVPKQVIRFLNQEQNRQLIHSVIGSGNINFLEDFCRGADIVAEKLQVPLLYRFELAGTQDDVENVRNGLHKWAEQGRSLTGQ